MATFVPDAGEEYAVDKLLDKTGSITTRPEYIGWGTGVAGGEAATGLTTPAAEARTLATCSKVGTGDAALYRAVGTITAAGARTITEVGLFTASAAGTLFVLSDVTSTVLATGEGIQFTIDINPE